MYENLLKVFLVVCFVIPLMGLLWLMADARKNARKLRELGDELIALAKKTDAQMESEGMSREGPAEPKPKPDPGFQTYYNGESMRTFLDGGELIAIRDYLLYAVKFVGVDEETGYRYGKCLDLVNRIQAVMQQREAPTSTEGQP